MEENIATKIGVSENAMPPQLIAYDDDGDTPF